MADTSATQMSIEMSEGDKWAEMAQRAVLATVTEWRECGRCNGKGYALFLGGDRAPGVCFGCGGTGRLIKGRNEARRVAAEMVEIERNRLRFAWVSTHRAMLAVTDGRLAEYVRAQLARTLKNIEERAATL